MRISDWAVKFNIAVKRWEERPDKQPGDVVYRVKDVFTTLRGSWDPADDYGTIPQWARAAYLKPWGAPDYFADAGAEQHLFALVLDLNGQPVQAEELVRYWSDGFDKLGDPGYKGFREKTPQPTSGWASLDIYNNYCPEAGERGAWCWCPQGAADVVVGGGLPNKHHVSTFAVWQAERHSGGGGGPTPASQTVTFSLERPQLSDDGSTALRWQIADVARVLLDGQAVDAPVVRQLKPGEATRYSLRVERAGGGGFTLDMAVRADPSHPDPGGGGEEGPHEEPHQEPGHGAAPRPPTVVLTAANVAHLRTFPRPPKDNGIGLHFHLDLPDPRESSLIAETIEHLKYIRATWTLIYAQDVEQAERAARPSWQAGIMPVVRIGAKINGSPVFPEPYVRMLQAIGAPPYVQIYNEPEDPREYEDYAMPSDWAQIFGQRWASVAAETIRYGGYAGLQVLSREAFDAAVDAVPGQGQADLWKRTFFVQHNYAENHPPAYPYDERNQKDHSGQTIVDDTLGTLSFLAYAAWMRERLGLVMPIIGGEGGWLYGAEKDPRYPKVEGPLHAQYTGEMFEWLRSGVLSNGEPTPDYLFSITPWIAGSFTFGAQNWWGNWIRAEGKLTETIEAVRGIPEFERRFSWG